MLLTLLIVLQFNKRVSCIKLATVVLSHQIQIKKKPDETHDAKFSKKYCLSSAQHNAAIFLFKDCNVFKHIHMYSICLLFVEEYLILATILKIQ